MLSKKGRTKWEFKTNKRKVHRFWFPGNLRLSESDIASGKNVFSFCMFRRTLTARLEPSAPPTPPPPETPQRWTQLPDQQRWLFKLTHTVHISCFQLKPCICQQYFSTWTFAGAHLGDGRPAIDVAQPAPDDQAATDSQHHRLKVTWKSPEGHLMVTCCWSSPAMSHSVLWNSGWRQYATPQSCKDLICGSRRE